MSGNIKQQFVMTKDPADAFLKAYLDENRETRTLPAEAEFSQAVLVVEIGRYLYDTATEEAMLRNQLSHIRFFG